MGRKLRIVSLVMLIIAVLFVILAFFSMDSTITLPLKVSTLHAIYRGYLIVMVLIFAASFLFRNKDSK